jgi:hypothetical protein
MNTLEREKIPASDQLNIVPGQSKPGTLFFLISETSSRALKIAPCSGIVQRLLRTCMLEAYKNKDWSYLPRE